MPPVEVEKNIEVLRQYTLLLQKEVARLASENASLKNAREATKQEWLDEKLRDQYSRLQKKFFSSGTETLPREDRAVGHKKEQLKLHGVHPSGEKEKEQGKHPFKGISIFNWKMSERELKRESLIRGINAEAEAWEEIPGLCQESKEITVHERIYVELTHRQWKYGLKKKYNKFGKAVILTSPGPPKVRSGSRYSIDFAVSVAVDKYGFHMPLERQRRKMEGQGLEIDVKTLYGLCEGVAEHCKSMEERIRQDIFQDFCALHVDETPWPIVGKDSDGYMWAVSNRRGAMYRFEPTRSGKVAEEMLEGYKGAALTDGFSGYNRIKKLPDLRVGACWAHARREFFDRLGDYSEAKEAVALIDRLFEIEAKATSFEELRELREKESKKILEEYKQWLLATAGKHLSQSGIRDAINYSLKFWKELTLFTQDLSLPLSNNDAERALRHIVMGRKNFNGSKTINGADTAASIYTVIETCKRVGLEPANYLKYLIEERWYREKPKTPYEYAMEKLGAQEKVTFPKKEAWKI